MNRVEIVKAALASRGNRSYLEIGCAGDDCFRNVQATRKVGVDPVSGGTHRTTSDEFFRSTRERFDVIFIDGCHHHDQVERDVRASLACLNDHGLIVMHDCRPPDAHHEDQGACGTAWRAFMHFRSDLSLEAYVGNFDYGVGMIRVQRNSLPISLPRHFSELSYGELLANEATWQRPLDGAAAAVFAGGGW